MHQGPGSCDADFYEMSFGENESYIIFQSVFQTGMDDPFETQFSGSKAPRHNGEAILIVSQGLFSL